MGIRPTKELFENRPVKRQTYAQLIAKMHLFKDKGCIVSLGGPAIEIHYKELASLLRRNSQLLFAEIDKVLIIDENLPSRIEALGDSRVKFYAGDIWDGIMFNYVQKQGWEHKHVLFDLDFCCTAPTAIKQSLYTHLSLLAKSKLPRKNGFWISLTFCRRGDLTNEWQRVISEIIQLFTNQGWQLSINNNITYAEKGGNKAKRRIGNNMVTMQFRFRWDYTKTPIKGERHG